MFCYPKRVFTNNFITTPLSLDWVCVRSVSSWLFATNQTACCCNMQSLWLSHTSYFFLAQTDHYEDHVVSCYVSKRVSVVIVNRKCKKVQWSRNKNRFQNVQMSMNSLDVQHTGRKYHNKRSNRHWTCNKFLTKYRRDERHFFVFEHLSEENVFKITQNIGGTYIYAVFLEVDFKSVATTEIIINIILL